MTLSQPFWSCTGATRCYSGYRDALNHVGTPGAAGPAHAGFASQNFVTTGAIRARQLDRHTDVALVGFDDIVLADVLAVTLLLQDVQAIGGLAAEVLFRWLDRDESPIRRHVIPTCLVPRGSGEIPGPFR